MLTRKVSAVLVTALTLLLVPATPALAHGADAPDATNYRITITSQPSIEGLRVRTIEAGARLQLTNHSGRNIEVLGYQNEPYLEIRPDGVYQNYHSPAAYLNITIAHVDPPAHADPTAPPLWQKVSDQPEYRWHDQRVLWTSAQPPGPPSQAQHIRDWTVPMRVDASPLQLKGSLDWVPPPAPWIWWLAAILGALAVALLGFAPPPRVPMALLAVAAGGLGVVYAVARERDAGNDTLGPILGQLFTAQLWSTLSGLAAVAAGVYALTRRPASAPTAGGAMPGPTASGSASADGHTAGDPVSADGRGRPAAHGGGDFALALGAGAAGLFAGMTNAAVFHRSITPVPWSATTARAVIATVIALGLGVALAAMLRLRGATPARPPFPAPADPPDADSPTTSPQPAEPSTTQAPPPR